MGKDHGIRSEPVVTPSAQVAERIDALPPSGVRTTKSMFAQGSNGPEVKCVKTFLDQVETASDRYVHDTVARTLVTLVVDGKASILTYTDSTYYGMYNSMPRPHDAKRWAVSLTQGGVEVFDADSLYLEAVSSTHFHKLFDVLLAGSQAMGCQYGPWTIKQ